MSSSPPLTVAVLAGGRSSEHEVSLRSGRAVADGLSAAGHRVIEVTLERDGRWRREDQELALRAGRGLLGADVVFPALHGRWGEDGTVQGMLEMLGSPYVGAGVAASAVCIDKVLFKRLMAQAGVAQVAWESVRRDRWTLRPGEAIEALGVLGLPVFVKPARAGSSLGIVKVDSDSAMSDALRDAFAHDALVIVEAMSPGLEIECSVVGRRHGECSDGQARAEASLPGEIVLNSGWYDFDAKYSPDAMTLQVPPRTSPAVCERVRALAVQTFVDVGCEGLARVDFFVEGEQVLVNELNTMPGFTPTSVYAKLFAASGLAYPDLVDRLCRLALERGTPATVPNGGGPT